MCDGEHGTTAFELIRRPITIPSPLNGERVRVRGENADDRPPSDAATNLEDFVSGLFTMARLPA